MTEIEQKIKKYYKAWWNCEVLDRVLMKVVAPRSDYQEKKVPEGTPEDWFDKEKAFNLVERNIQKNFYGGMAFPQYWPNFGVDVFSAFLGTTLQFSPMGSEHPTSWADWNKPVLNDYTDLTKLELKEDNRYFQKIKEFTEYALERSQGKYVVGITDLHPGMDALAVLRGGPEKICMDLYDNAEGVKKAMKVIWETWHKVYEECFKIISKKQKGTSAWINLYAPGKMYPIQNDFTCLISTEMYEEFFMEELMNQINYLDYSIYHLDGPEALKHLDRLLEIPKLNAIQWVCGAGLDREGVAKWFPIYKKIQLKKKAIVVYCSPKEIDSVLDNLSPEGLLIETGCSSEQEAKELLASKGWG